jgi:hypothetical protein
VAQLGRDPAETAKLDRDPVDNDWSGVRRYEVIHDDHAENLVPLDDLLGLEEKIAGNPLLFYSIGNEYWEKGDREKALAYFNKARKLGLLELTGKEGDPAAKKAAYHEFREAILSTNRNLASSKVFKSPIAETLTESPRMSDPAALEDFVKW